MNDEIIFDTMFTGDEYLALPSDVQNECVKVACYSSGQAGMRVRCVDGTNGKVVWRGAHLYPYLLTGNKNWYAHRSQHPARMSASGFVVRGPLDALWIELQTSPQRPRYVTRDHRPENALVGTGSVDIFIWQDTLDNMNKMIDVENIVANKLTQLKERLMPL